MKTKYYVIYMDYSEYNQFEGSWERLVKDYDSFNEAKKEADDMRSSHYDREVVGPLVEVSSASEIVDLEKYKKALSLIDGVYDLVFIRSAQSSAQQKWKQDWLNAARELGASLEV